ncbi:DUF4407 domain-containing protein [Modestobacter sp. NPDC049651]|uniref:DUF4407 domain-containing protein n=1 Tax=unclassified Modestobacter TaxID=2643866 RepID=UPI0033CB8F50
MTLREMLRVPVRAVRTVRAGGKRAVGEGLLTVSGANRDVLRDAPKERTKQVAMGAVLVSSAGIAAVSGSYAFHVALHLPWVLALVAGLAWGLVILNLDRWRVVSSPRLTTKLGTLGLALPRLLLAVLIGAVISTPLTLAVFSSEINTEVKVMAAEEEDAFTKKLAADSRYDELPQLRDQQAALQTDLQNGVTDADVNADPAVVALQSQVDDVTARYNAAVQAVFAETDGSGGTGVPGIGAAALEKMAERDRLRAELDGLQGQLDALKPQVRAQLQDEETKKSADQKRQLAALTAQIAGTEKQRAAEIAAHREAVGQGDGILARLEALGRLQDGNPSAATAHWLLFAFMAALECMPILFKTMLALAPPSLYERLTALDEERAEAKVRLRMQTEYEEAETLARSALAAAEARAARTLEAESRATGMVLDAQLAVTQADVDRWRDTELGRRADDDLESLLRDPNVVAAAE